MKNRGLNIMVKTLAILIIIGIVIFGTSVYLNAKDNTKTEENKLEEEIDYLESKITSLINALNNIQLANYKVVVSKVEKSSDSSGGSDTSSSESQGGESSKEKEQSEGEESTSKENTTITKMEKDLIISDLEDINWDWMKGETEVFYSVWSQIVLDLYDKGISSDKILEFSNGLDEAIISIKNNDKQACSMNLARLYNIIPEFANYTAIDEIKKNTLQMKKYVINAYANVNSDNWETTIGETDKAERAFMQTMNNIGKEEERKKYNINKAYILLEELKNSLSKKDTEIFYIKYKNLLEEINVLI